MIFEKEGKQLTPETFSRLTGARWIETLEFDPPDIYDTVFKKVKKLYQKGEVTVEQLWLGKFFCKEILFPPSLPIAIRWIDPSLGWGVFALSPLKKMQFIAEYTGRVRKKKKCDEKNSYCFEYLLAPGFSSSYTVDAREQGSLARYINHSQTPNLISALATLDGINHIILYTKESVAKGTQLCYDYGPDYWSKRAAPTPTI